MEIKTLIILSFIVSKVLSLNAFLPECKGLDYKQYKNCKGFSKNEDFTEYVKKNLVINLGVMYGPEITMVHLVISLENIKEKVQ